MRFVPESRPVRSPRRRKPTFGGYGGMQPPVLARLPEISVDSEAKEEETTESEPIESAEADIPSPEAKTQYPEFGIGSSAGPKVRIDQAHSYTAQMGVDPNDVATSTMVGGPVLPPLPTEEFAATAAKILAHLETAASRPTVEEVVDTSITSSLSAADVDSGSINDSNSHCVAQAADSEIVDTEIAKPETADHVDYKEPRLTHTEIRSTPERQMRIDPGIPKPKPFGTKSKRRKVREAEPELAKLERPWHDWIVELGGTFIAGLLLIAAYQAWQPKPKDVVAEPDVPAATFADEQTQSPTAESFRVAANPPPLQTFDPSLEPITPPSEPPTFVDPSDLDADDQFVDIGADNSPTDNFGGGDFGNESSAMEPPTETMVDDMPSMEPSSMEPPAIEPPASIDTEVVDESRRLFDELADQLMPAPATLTPEASAEEVPTDRPTEVSAVIENNLVSGGERSGGKTEHGGPQLFDNPTVTPPKEEQSPYPSTGYAVINDTNVGFRDVVIPTGESGVAPQPTATPQPNPPAVGTPQPNLPPQAAQARAVAPNAGAYQPQAQAQVPVYPQPQPQAYPQGYRQPQPQAQPRFRPIAAMPQQYSPTAPVASPQFPTGYTPMQNPRVARPPAAPNGGGFGSPMSVRLNGTIQQFSR